ncbi:MAG: aminotransferase class I/II-fold pyridoxal phosphate-dependent enzyme [Defluviitaleaceae bacterium]|nr:aminotransferase class I/II-fold pyridoxal phosphate-dependent enzyme [Defluviitaleaceae bacterium]MCL2263077.1 aminotransferase class I/II-fold pyridoxal phosphate-dependent enzyme [Defluviitaleaceae bacterium]
MHKEIEDYLTRGLYPFHMPGHKRNAKFFPTHSNMLDLTEIPCMDVLSSPRGIIKNFQKKIAEFFFAEESFFLVNGSSSGIIAALCAVFSDAEKKRPLFAARNSHVSFYNGLVFCGAKPTYFMPEITADGLAGGVSPKPFDDIPQGAVVFLVSPTYEGFVSDIAAIAQKVHAANGILIVDEAHGAHFPFHERFPKSAMQLGADISINSLHKTLPAISGCAVLHANSARVDLSRLKFFINAMQTTSPSYMLMASCDFMLEKLWREPHLFEEYVTRLDNFRQELSGETGTLRLIGRERIGENAIFDMDDGKLLFASNTCADSAEEIAEIFAQKYKLQFEMAKGNHLLAMTSVADTAEGFARLNTAAREYGATCRTACTKPATAPSPTLPEIILTPRQAAQSQTETIPAGHATGRISAEIIADYPPGIAKIVPGERITDVIEKPYVRVVKE